MQKTMEDIIKSARALPKVPPKEAAAYQRHLEHLTQYVNRTLASEPGIHELIGNNPLEVMYENHRHHGAFMATVFNIVHYELLAKTIPWVYRAYHGHGFSYDYFPLELKTWCRAVEERISTPSMKAVQAVYQWMIDIHEDMIAASKSELPFEMPVDEDWLESKKAFTAALLQGDHRRCLDLAETVVTTHDDVTRFYLQILQPVMYEIGVLWERGEISVATEHLASAIVGRVMATLNPRRYEAPLSKGKIIITASPNEFHEIGAWMLSDVLEQDGWEVRYLGANMPAADLIDMVTAYQPDVLAISVTMPFNVDKVRDLIGEFRNDPKTESLKIIVGGHVFNDINKLWQMVGADGFASNLDEAVRIIGEWSSRDEKDVFA